MAQFKWLNDYKNHLTTDEWLSLAMFSKVEEFNNLEAICEVNSPSNCVYLVMVGEVAVVKGRRVKYNHSFIQQSILATLSAGDLFGEAGVLNHSNRYSLYSIRSSSCVAVGKVVCLSIDGKIFENCLQSYYKERTEQIVHLIQKASQFKDYEKATITSLIGVSIVTNPGFNEMLMTEKKENNFFFMVLQGSVEFVSYIDNRTKRSIQQLQKNFLITSEISLLKLYKGDCFGDEAGFEIGKPSLFNVRVTSHICKVIKIPMQVSGI